MLDPWSVPRLRGRGEQGDGTVANLLIGCALVCEEAGVTP